VHTVTHDADADTDFDTSQLHHVPCVEDCYPVYNITHGTINPISVVTGPSHPFV